MSIVTVNYYLHNPNECSRSLIFGATEEKDLGVWCTSEMKPSLQVQKAVAKAMQTLGMIKRSFKYLSKDSFLFLYSQTVSRILCTNLVIILSKRH